jgi:hypothetical protein
LDLVQRTNRLKSLKAAVPAAVRRALDKKRPGPERAAAVRLVVTHGSAIQLAKLKPLLDESVVVEKDDIGGHQCESQLRDLLLAAFLESEGKHLGEYGFPKDMDFALVGFGMMPGFVPYFHGFANDAQRENAFKKWKKGAGKLKIPREP